MGALHLSLTIGACLFSFLVEAMDAPSRPTKAQKAPSNFSAYDTSGWAGIHTAFVFFLTDSEYDELRDALRSNNALIRLRTRENSATSPNMTPLMIALERNNTFLLEKLKQDGIITDRQIKGAERELNARKPQAQTLHDELQAVFRARQERQARTSASAIPAEPSDAGLLSLRRTAMLATYMNDEPDSEPNRPPARCNGIIQYSAQAIGIAFLLLVLYGVSYGTLGSHHG